MCHDKRSTAPFWRSRKHKVGCMHCMPYLRDFPRHTRHNHKRRVTDCSFNLGAPFFRVPPSHLAGLLPPPDAQRRWCHAGRSASSLQCWGLAARRKLSRRRPKQWLTTARDGGSLQLLVSLSLLDQKMSCRRQQQAVATNLLDLLVSHHPNRRGEYQTPFLSSWAYVCGRF